MQKFIQDNPHLNNQYERLLCHSLWNKRRQCEKYQAVTHVNEA